MGMSMSRRRDFSRIKANKEPRLLAIDGGADALQRKK
jgi:hypothetical protein